MGNPEIDGTAAEGTPAPSSVEMTPTPTPSPMVLDVVEGSSNNPPNLARIEGLQILVRLV